MKYEFHPEALAEYQADTHFYARQRPDLELRFIYCVEEAIELVLADPFRWRAVEEDVRRCLTRVFPYAILYPVEPDCVLLLAVAHCSRKPGYWRDRLRSSN